MTIVKFENEHHGEMITSAENWIRFEMFDAENKAGDRFPVTKDTCKFLDCFESEQEYVNLK
jgi:hypothetical protein